MMSAGLSALFLSIWRFETGRSLDVGEHDEVDFDDKTTVEIPFQRVNLTFKDIHYTVKASTKDEYIEILKGIDGFVEAGKMTALMGSSGGEFAIAVFLKVSFLSRENLISPR